MTAIQSQRLHQRKAQLCARTMTLPSKSSLQKKARLLPDATQSRRSNKANTATTTLSPTFAARRALVKTQRAPELLSPGIRSILVRMRLPLFPRPPVSPGSGPLPWQLLGSLPWLCANAYLYYMQAPTCTRTHAPYLGETVLMIIVTLTFKK